MARGICPVCRDPRAGVEDGLILRHTRGGQPCTGAGKPPAQPRSTPSGRLTQLEWWALCAAVAEREASLTERAEQGERVGKDRAALTRAMEKLRDAAAPTGRWDTSRR